MSTPKTSLVTIVTVVEIKDYGNGKIEYTEQKSDEPTFPDLHSGNRKEIDVPLPAPGLSLVGYYDVDDKEIGIYTKLFGSQLGSKYTAGLDSGIHAGFNFGITSGRYGIRKVGNKLKLEYHFSVGVGFLSKDFDDDFDLFDV